MRQPRIASHCIYLYRLTKKTLDFFVLDFDVTYFPRLDFEDCLVLTFLLTIFPRLFFLRSDLRSPPEVRDFVPRHTCKRLPDIYKNTLKNCVTVPLHIAQRICSVGGTFSI